MGRVSFLLIFGSRDDCKVVMEFVNFHFLVNAALLSGQHCFDRLSTVPLLDKHMGTSVS